SGSSCVRIGCQTGFSNPSTISSTTAATLGTHSSTNPGRLCPSRDATGQQSITQSEDWYKLFRFGPAPIAVAGTSTGEEAENLLGFCPVLDRRSVQGAVLPMMLCYLTPVYFVPYARSKLTRRKDDGPPFVTGLTEMGVRSSD